MQNITHHTCLGRIWGSSHPELSHPLLTTFPNLTPSSSLMRLRWSHLDHGPWQRFKPYFRPRLGDGTMSRSPRLYSRPLSISSNSTTATTTTAMKRLGAFRRRLGPPNSLTKWSSPVPLRHFCVSTPRREILDVSTLPHRIVPNYDQSPT